MKAVSGLLCSALVQYREPGTATQAVQHVLHSRDWVTVRNGFLVLFTIIHTWMKTSILFYTRKLFVMRIEI